MRLDYTIVVLLVAAIGIYYFFFAKGKKNKEEFKNENQHRTFSIENVGPEGKIGLSNFGEDDEFLNITITEKTRHYEDDNFWYELDGTTSQGNSFWLQIESINPLEMNGGTEELDFNSLGISTLDLEEMQARKKAFQSHNQQFYFESNGEAQVYQSDSQDDDDFRWYRYWNFTNQEESVFIAIQQLEDLNPRVSISYPIEKNQLRIFELGEDVG